MAIIRVTGQSEFHYRERRMNIVCAIRNMGSSDSTQAPSSLLSNLDGQPNDIGDSGPDASSDTSTLLKNGQH